MIAIDASAVRETFARGRAYELMVPSSLQLGVLEDALAELRALGIETAGYDIRAAARGCIVEIRESGECMVEADLMHTDLRLLAVGEGIDHHIDYDADGAPQAIHVVSARTAVSEQLVEANEPTRACSTSASMTAHVIFGWIEAFVPKRYTDEELGDALEQIHQRVADGCSPWWVRLKIVTTVFWILVHFAVEEYARFTKAVRR